MNWSDILSLEHGDVTVQGASQQGQRADGSVEIHYALPVLEHPAAIRWLWENRPVVQDANVRGTTLEGVWRTVSIQTREQRDRTGNLQGAVLVQTLNKGYYDKWNWDAARVVETGKQVGNEKTIIGTASSFLYYRRAAVRLPFVDPVQAKNIAEGLEGVSFKDLSVGGVTFDGVWFNMGAFHEEGDESSSVVLRLGRPKIIIEGYRGENTWEKEQRFYVSNCPIGIAQDVCEAWKTLDGTVGGTPRKGATATMDGAINADLGTVNIILSVTVTEEVEGQRVRTTKQCSETIVESHDLNKDAKLEFGAGEGQEDEPGVGERKTITNEETPLGEYNVTKETRTAHQQSVKVPEYKSDIDHIHKEETHRQMLPENLAHFLDGTFGTAETSHQVDFTEDDPDALRGVRRRIIVDINPDCTLSVRGQSTEAHEAGDDLDPPIGESWTVLHDMGLYWNQTKDQVLAVLAGLTAQTVGVTRQVVIQRNDLGRFDMRVQVRTHSEFLAEAEATGNGIKVHTRAGINSTSVPDVGAAKRERVSLHIDPDEKGQISWRATKHTVPKIVPKTFVASTGTGITEKVVVGSSFDDSDLTIPPSGPGIHVSPNIQVEGDGALSGGYTETEYPEAPMAEKKFGSKLLHITSEGMTNGRDQPEMDYFVGEDGVTVRFVGRMNPDKTIGWDRVEEKAIAANAPVSAGHRESDFLLIITKVPHRNQPQSALENDIPETDGVHVSFSDVRLYDNNTCDFVKVTQTLDLLATTCTLMDEDIWQKRDQVIGQRAWGWMWYDASKKWSHAGIKMFGRKQKRRIQRTITRTFSWDRPTIIREEDHRQRAGNVQMGPFTVHYLDDEYVDIGDWEGDPSGTGLYIETVEVDPGPEEE